MIKVFTTRKDFDHYRHSLEDKRIGLVPTMGNLHEGHISLVQKSAYDNDVTIVTIFVNPTQFGPTEDFDKYPRTLEEDLKKLSASALLFPPVKEVVVFAPIKNEDIYPAGFSTVISVGDITKKLEGAARPTHFDGVTTVVYRLFAIARAHHAYFGQKDYQQCLVIQKMVLDLEIPIQIHVCPIVRNADGLALSSRNQYLSPEEKKEALNLPHTLKKIASLIGEKKSYTPFIEQQRTDPRWSYLEVLDAKTLNPPTSTSTQLVVIGTFVVGKTRLLDNILC